MESGKTKGGVLIKTIELTTLPQVKFAHVFKAASYSNSLWAKAHSIEVTYISEGEIRIASDGREEVAKKGDVVCSLLGETQIRITADSYHEHHTMMAECAWAEQSNANGLILPLVTPAGLNTANAANLIEQAVRNQLLFKDSPSKGASLFLQLLCEIDYCNRKSRKSNLPSESLYASRAKEYVQKNIHAPMTQKEVAEYLGISPEYLCSVFKKSEDITFIQYVNREKLEAIRVLMEKEHLRLYEAASLYGYADPNYVSRLFKKTFGFNLSEGPNYYR